MDRSLQTPGPKRGKKRGPKPRDAEEGLAGLGGEGGGGGGRVQDSQVSDLENGMDSGPSSKLGNAGGVAL